MLAFPEQDRAFLARQMIASLDPEHDPDAEMQWRDEIDRRSREILEGWVACRPVDEVIREIRARLHAPRDPS